MGTNTSIAAALAEQKRLMTVAEVAELLQMSPAWVRQHAAGDRRPFIPCVRMGKAMRFDPDEIAEFIAEMKRIFARMRQ